MALNTQSIAASIPMLHIANSVALACVGWLFLSILLNALWYSEQPFLTRSDENGQLKKFITKLSDFILHIIVVAGFLPE
jgi:hypothetical protein